jgi:hypothetical protein
LQGELHPSLSWTQIAFGILASFIGGGGAYKLFNVWLNRKKPQAEIHLTDATADKTRAEARKIHAEADVQFNAIVERLHIRIEEMAASAVKVREERDEYKLRNELQQIELRMRDDQIKKMKGVLDMKGIRLSDFDEQK